MMAHYSSFIHVTVQHECIAYIMFLKRHKRESTLISSGKAKVFLLPEQCLCFKKKTAGMEEFNIVTLILKGTIELWVPWFQMIMILPAMPHPLTHQGGRIYLGYTPNKTTITTVLILASHLNVVLVIVFKMPMPLKWHLSFSCILVICSFSFSRI